MGGGGEDATAADNETSYRVGAYDYEHGGLLAV
jgi:hypothetical protein